MTQLRRLDLMVVADALNELATFPDQLTTEERCSAGPPGEFWDRVDARPRRQTPAAIGADLARRLRPRDQGGRRTCVAFALIAAIELRTLRLGSTLDLSEQHASFLLAQAMGRDPASAEEGIRLVDAAKALKGQRICAESDCRYLPIGSAPSTRATARARYSIEDYFIVPRLPSRTDPIGPLTPCVDGPGISNTAYLEVLLASGYDIVVSLCLTDTQLMDRDTGIVVIDCNREASRGVCVPRAPNFAHAITILGYDRTGDVPYFIGRDSLPGLSDKKPLLVSYDYLRAYAAYGIVVTRIGTRRAAEEGCTC